MRMHQSYGRQEFDEHACFLCGEHMDGDNSAEHVFPKWLLNRYDLWNQKIDLLNGSLMPYRQLTIPCCAQCNNEHLSRIENQINASVEGGYEKAIKIPERSWYLWAGKIFYGILRKEIALLLNRSNPNDGTIVTEEILESFSNLHLFMQGIRERHQFTGNTPYSVLICNLHDFGGLYDFRDNLFLFTLAIRMGDIGVIVSFEDGGLIRETYARYVKQVGSRKLHPIQFYELYAKVSYQVKLRQRPLSYLTQSHVDGDYVASTEVVGSSTQLDNWDQREFSEVLSFHVSSWLSGDSQVEFAPPDRVSTWMTDSNGELLLLSREEWEAPNKKSQPTQ